jgi:hypothetical protein
MTYCKHGNSMQLKKTGGMVELELELEPGPPVAPQQILCHGLSACAATPSIIQH